MSKLPQVLVNVRFKASKNEDPLESVPVQKRLPRLKISSLPMADVLLRKSGTEPLIRVMVEASDAQLAKWCAE